MWHRGEGMSKNATLRLTHFLTAPKRNPNGWVFDSNFYIFFEKYLNSNSYEGRL